MQLLHCKPQQRKRKKLSFTQNTNGSCFPKAKQIGHRLSLQISCLLQMERKFSWRHHICLGTTTFRIHVSVFGNQNSRRRPVVCPGNPQEQELVGQSSHSWEGCKYHRTDQSWQKPAQFCNCHNHQPDWNNTDWSVGNTHQWCNQRTLVPNELFGSVRLVLTKEAFNNIEDPN